MVTGSDGTRSHPSAAVMMSKRLAAASAADDTPPLTTPLDALPDEIIVIIGACAADTCMPSKLGRLASTNKTVRRLLAEGTPFAVFRVDDRWTPTRR